MNGPGAARSAWHSARNTPAKQAAPRRPRTAEPAARSRVDGDHVPVSTAPPSAFDRVRDVQRRSSAVMRRVRSDTHVGAGAGRARSPVPDPSSAANDDDGDGGTFVEWWSAADATVHVGGSLRPSRSPTLARSPMRRPKSAAALTQTVRVSAFCKAANDKLRPHLQAILSTQGRGAGRGTRLGGMLWNRSGAGFGSRVLKMAQARRVTHAIQAHTVEERRRKLKQRSEASAKQAKAARAAEAEKKERMKRIRAAAFHVRVSATERRLAELREAVPPSQWKLMMAGEDEWSKRLRQKKREAPRDKLQRNKDALRDWQPDARARKRLEHAATLQRRRERAATKAKRMEARRERRAALHTSAARNQRRARSTQALQFRERERRKRLGLGPAAIRPRSAGPGRRRGVKRAASS